MFKQKESEHICGNCEHIDTSVVLTVYPPKYRCLYYGIGVFWTDKCHDQKITFVNLDDMPDVVRYDVFDESE